MTNSKKRIIVLLGCLAMLFIMIIGTSYAYYAANVKGNTSATPSLKLTSGYLSIIYDGESSTISGGSAEGITDDLEYTKTFSVTNDGVVDANFGIWIKNYQVKDAEGAETTLTYPDDWTYVLSSGDTIIKTGVFPTSDEALISVYPLIVNETKTLTLKLTYNYITAEEAEELGMTETEAAYQSSDMGKVLSFDIAVTQSIDNLNNTSEGTLLYAINEQYQNSIVRNESDLITVPGQATSTAEEAILATTEDDFGTSYYYRGAVVNNYVNYSGMCWRIVRVQGDGTIKLVLADENGECNADTYSTSNTTSALINNATTYSYSSDTSENGLIYATGNIPGELTTWMNSKITDANNLIKTEWCNDISINSSTEEEILYGGNKRLQDNIYAKPTLKCNMTGLEDSKALKYESEIGILTADEVAFAGGVNTTTNSTYYLRENAQNEFWTMTPLNFKSSDTLSYLWKVSTGELLSNLVNNSIGIRPAVVLKNDALLDTTISGQTGTQTNPYVIAN